MTGAYVEGWSELDARCRNAILFKFGQPLTKAQVKEIYAKSPHTFLKVRNIGRKSNRLLREWAGYTDEYVDRERRRASYIWAKSVVEEYEKEFGDE